MATANAPESVLDVVVRRWAPKPGNLIMILHDIQDHYGYVSWEMAKEVGRRIDVPVARIYEVLTFYNYFKIEPPGDHVISVCTGTACHLKRSETVLEEFSTRLGIKEGESTSDGKFHLQSVRCVGCCGLAPVTTVDAKVFGRLKPGDAQRIVAEYEPQEGRQ
ncbi:MAG: NADH-quinone oxidoreductase subunit NuoE family protein [Chloroflexota bacterium]